MSAAARVEQASYPDVARFVFRGISEGHAAAHVQRAGYVPHCTAEIGPDEVEVIAQRAAWPARVSLSSVAAWLSVGHAAGVEPYPATVGDVPDPAEVAAVAALGEDALYALAVGIDRLDDGDADDCATARRLCRVLAHAGQTAERGAVWPVCQSGFGNALNGDDVTCRYDGVWDRWDGCGGAVGFVGPLYVYGVLARVVV